MAISWRPWARAAGAQAFEAHAFQAGIAALGKVAPAVAGFPGGGAVGHFASQAHAIIGQGATDIDGLAEMTGGRSERAIGRSALRVMQASVGTAPLGAAAVIVVTVGAQGVAVQTERQVGLL